MQNWANWVDNKWVDFLTPMSYTANDSVFTTLVSDQRALVGTKTILAPGIGLHMQKNAADQTVRQIAISRKEQAFGQTLFASAYYGDAQELALQKGPYAEPAALPFRDPLNMSKQLSDCASAFKIINPDRAAYLNTLAASLSQYVTYKCAPSQYITPTQPPLDIPDHVIPLPSVKITQASGQINIDGNLDEPTWANATRVQLAYDNLAEPASVCTTALLSYDDKNLYVAFEASEAQMDKLKATVSKRDGPTFYDDSVEVFLDPTMKRREYYHLSTNTLGTRFDQKVLSPSWNGEWSTATRRGADKWTTEIAIPFATLSAPAPKPGAQWAINLTRNRPIGAMQYLTWAVPYGSFHNPDRFGVIEFK
jgi:hypothetical protein